MSLLGFNREDLKEGKCEKVQGVMEWKPRSAQICGEAPGYFLHLGLVRTMQPMTHPEHNHNPRPRTISE